MMNTTNPIEEVLKELQFTDVQKEGFIKFLRHANTCLENGESIKQVKQHLDEVVKTVVAKSK